MRWDRFFDDLESQLAAEWDAERAALDSEAERLRFSRVSMRERLRGLAEREKAAGPHPSFELADGLLVTAAVVAVGADWLALHAAAARAGQLIVPFASIAGIRIPQAELLRTARVAQPASRLSDRMTFGFVMRDLMRRRVGVAVHVVGGRVLTGTIDRAGADHLDLAVHEPGAARRASDVTGHRLVPFAAIAYVRAEGRPTV